MKKSLESQEDIVGALPQLPECAVEVANAIAADEMLRAVHSLQVIGGMYLEEKQPKNYPDEATEFFMSAARQAKEHLPGFFEWLGFKGFNLRPLADVDLKRAEDKIIAFSGHLRRKNVFYLSRLHNASVKSVLEDM